MISLGNVRYSVPHTLTAQPVFVRVDGDEVVIAHHSRDGVCEVARHPVSTPGNPRIDVSHYPPRSASKILDHPRAQNAGRAAFLALGSGAAAWLTAAAAAGTARIKMKMDQATEFAAVYGNTTVDAALATAAEAGRFAQGDLASILRHQQRAADPDRVVVPISEHKSLQPGTARWKELS